MEEVILKFCKAFACFVISWFVLQPDLIPEFLADACISENRPFRRGAVPFEE